MSESVIDSGKLIPVTLSDEEAVAELERLDADDWAHCYNSPHEALASETDEYADIEGLGFCRVAGFKTEDPTESSCTLTKNEDGSYDFRANYYNGGAHWTELVEWQMQNGSSTSEMRRRHTIHRVHERCESPGGKAQRR